MKLYFGFFSKAIILTPIGGATFAAIWRTMVQLHDQRYKLT